jgi:PAS domain S-box-containing protein
MTSGEPASASRPDPSRASSADREVDDLYRALAEDLQVGVLVQGPQAEILLSNPMALRLLGLTEDQVRGRTSFDPAWNVVHEDGAPFPAPTLPVPRAIAERRAVRGVVVGVDRPRTSDRVWLLVDAIPRLRSDGAVQHVVCTFADITERVSAEQRLRASERALQASQRVAHLGSWAWHVKTNRLEWSDEMFRIFGIDPAGFAGDLGAVIAAAIHPDDRAAVERSNRSVMEEGKPIPLEYRVVRPDGTIRVVDAEAGELVRDEAGRPELLSGIVQDVTDRKQSEQSLRELTGRLHLAMASARAGIWDWHVPTNQMLWDDRMLEIYGLTRESFPGGVIAWEQGLHPEDRARALEECAAALRGEREFDTEFRVLRPDGAICHVKANGLVLRDERGEAVRMIGINTDVTDRKRAEEERTKLESQLHQSQKMESVGRLAGGVAHDFNNMLGVILGNAEMVLDRLDRSSPLRDGLQEIVTAANRSADLTRQLLAFARKQTVTPRAIELNARVQQTLRLLERLIGENVRVTFRPGDALWPIHMDPSQIDQILTNLCVNARDAITGIGEVIIETANVSLDEAYCAAHEGSPASSAGEYVRLSVRDDGCGMDEATRARIFEPFFATKEVGRGSGLGLATVYGIVKQNKGMIDVSSEPGRGTRFDLHFPRLLATAAEAPRADAPAERSVRGHETILLVEDEAAILRLTTRMLERNGHTVLAAATPREGLRLSEAHPG